MHATTSKPGTCVHTGCNAMEANDGASTPDVLGLCSLHRQRSRNKRGVCPNCSGGMRPVERVHEYKPDTLVPNGRECVRCGYHQRPRR